MQILNGGLNKSNKQRLDWNPVTKEEAIASGDKMAVYSASKKYSELALWEWAKEHPHVEVATGK